MRLELGLLGDEGRVEMYDYAAAGGDFCQGVSNDVLGFEPFKLGVGGRERDADLS